MEYIYIIIGLIIFLLFLILHIKSLNEIINELKRKSGQKADRYGRSVECLVPFMKDFKYPLEELHFLGKPIDYISFDFEHSKITLIEVKSGKSQLSERQIQIQEIVKNGNIYFDVVKVD